MTCTSNKTCLQEPCNVHRYVHEPCKHPTVVILWIMSRKPYLKSGTCHHVHVISSCTIRTDASLSPGARCRGEGSGGCLSFPIEWRADALNNAVKQVERELPHNHMVICCQDTVCSFDGCLSRPLDCRGLQPSMHTSNQCADSLCES